MGGAPKSDYVWSKYWSAGPTELENALTVLLPPPSPVRTLDDMDETEIRGLEARYGCKVIRPNGKKPVAETAKGTGGSRLA